MRKNPFFEKYDTPHEVVPFGTEIPEQQTPVELVRTTGAADGVHAVVDEAVEHPGLQILHALFGGAGAHALMKSFSHNHMILV